MADYLYASGALYGSKVKVGDKEFSFDFSTKGSISPTDSIILSKK